MPRFRYVIIDEDNRPVKIETVKTDNGAYAWNVADHRRHALSDSTGKTYRVASVELDTKVDITINGMIDEKATALNYIAWIIAAKDALEMVDLVMRDTPNLGLADTLLSNLRLGAIEACGGKFSPSVIALAERLRVEAGVESDA
jgi:desulfoferrodoxin (superoxide reductase-like protein)